MNDSLENGQLLARTLFLRSCFLLSMIWNLVPVSGRAERPDLSSNPLDDSANDDMVANLRADIEYLASEELRGRSVADETIDIAADYVAGRMTGAGLDTTMIDGGPFQKVSIQLDTQAGPADENRVAFKFADSQPAQSRPTIFGELGEGMNPMSIGSDQGRVSGRLAFVGYGISSKKYDYDDYAGLDVNGAIVMMLRKEPQPVNRTSSFGGKTTTNHAFFTTKIANAIRHGASAVILINDPASVQTSLATQQKKIKGELARKAAITKQISELPAEAINNRKTLTSKVEGIDSIVAGMKAELTRIERGVLEIGEAGRREEDTDAIPVLSLGRDLADQVLRATRTGSLQDVEQRINATVKPHSKIFDDVTVSLRVHLKPTMRPSSNVIGVLEGCGPLASETIVVGAHYDHVGMGGIGSLAPGTIAVHNGADDNASGTATMLAVAKRMNTRLAEVTSHRRIVFIAFTGEERGLLGSKHYARHPRFALESTVAMINLDMVGRLRDNELTVYGTGSGHSMDDVVEQANKKTKFNLYKVPSGYGPSDHMSFYVQGVPVLFFFTGLHDDYHRPTDDFVKIDFNNLSRITDIVSYCTFELACRSERPQYTTTGKGVKIRRQLTAYLGVTLSGRGDNVVLSGIAEGGPAERAGLRAGDQIIEFEKKKVNRIPDLLDLLRAQSPGDVVEVGAIREGRVLRLKARLAPRPGG